MSVTRRRVTFTAKLQKDVQQLGDEWGLDFNNMVTHCCALVLQQEKERKEKAAAKVMSHPIRKVSPTAR